MVGRSSSVPTLKALLADSRFVTIVGPGGVGKTTLAVAVAHEMAPAFGDFVVFVDLSALRDPTLIAPSVASMLGLSVQSEDPTPSLVAYLRDKRVLLVLDNCEHVIEGIAGLTARIIAAAPQVNVLATSREAMRVEGEQIYQLMPLTVPPEESGLTMEAALTYSAVQLFVERALARGARLEQSDSEAVLIASICRKLDGLALAIELVAGRVGTYGLSETLALLDQRLNMLWLGQRSAPPRQQTLRAMLDWSYELLSEAERLVLCRLAVFVGPFTLQAALAVVADTAVEESDVFEAIDNLIAKSMVTTVATGPATRYRLPETTRAYALGTDTHAAGHEDLARRHATYYRHKLERAEREWLTLPQAPDRSQLLADLGNVRAALEWCFSLKGDTALGVRLACAAAPLFLALSLLTECLRWSERALLALRNADREEMHLRAAFGMSFMFTRGNNELARAALTRSLSLAQELDDPLSELRALSLLHMFHRRIGDYHKALQCAERSSALARTTNNTRAMALAHTLLGVSLYHVGELASARVELEAALQLRQDTDWSSTFHLGFDHYNLSGAILARTLWLQGCPDQALDRARRTVEEASRMDHPVTMSIAFTWALSVFLWTRDLENAAETLKYSFAYSAAHSLTPNLMQGRGFEGELALCRNDIESGIRKLQECLAEIETARYALLATPFSMSLAQGYVAQGKSDEALKLVDQAITAIKTSGELVYMPELLRIKGSACLAMHPPMYDSAETYFLQALEWSRRQGARSWAVRTAMDLACLWSEQGKAEAARSLLEDVLRPFEEGWQTADLKAAANLLEQLSRNGSSNRRGLQQPSAAQNPIPERTVTDAVG
jgi:predicted ATPase